MAALRRRCVGVVPRRGIRLGFFVSMGMGAVSLRFMGISRRARLVLASGRQLRLLVLGAGDPSRAAHVHRTSSTSSDSSAPRTDLGRPWRSGKSIDQRSVLSFHYFALKLHTGSDLTTGDGE